MKSYPGSSTLAFFLAAIAILSGCVTHTTVKNESRRPVQFSSPQAAQTFYDAFLAKTHPSDQGNSIAVSVSLPYWHRTVASENIRINDAIQSADLDQDGIISDSEAEAYATKVKNRTV